LSVTLILASLCSLRLVEIRLSSIVRCVEDAGIV
jgi:hypothetical protein